MNELRKFPTYIKFKKKEKIKKNLTNSPLMPQLNYHKLCNSQHKLSLAESGATGYSFSPHSLVSPPHSCPHNRHTQLIVACLRAAVVAAKLSPFRRHCLSQQRGVNVASSRDASAEASLSTSASLIAIECQGVFNLFQQLQINSVFRFSFLFFFVFLFLF